MQGRGLVPGLGAAQKAQRPKVNRSGLVGTGSRESWCLGNSKDDGGKEMSGISNTPDLSSLREASTKMAPDLDLATCWI